MTYALMEKPAAEKTADIAAARNRYAKAGKRSSHIVTDVKNTDRR